MPKPFFGPQPVPEYKPSDETRTAIREWMDSVRIEEEKRHAARAAIANDLKADTSLPYRSVAAHPLVPWSEATLRLLANEFDIPLRQPNKGWKQDRARPAKQAEQAEQAQQAEQSED